MSVRSLVESVRSLVSISQAFPVFVPPHILACGGQPGRRVNKRDHNLNVNLPTIIKTYSSSKKFIDPYVSSYHSS